MNLYPITSYNPFKKKFPFFWLYPTSLSCSWRAGSNSLKEKRERGERERERGGGVFYQAYGGTNNAKAFTIKRGITRNEPCWNIKTKKGKKSVSKNNWKISSNFNKQWKEKQWMKETHRLRDSSQVVTINLLLTPHQQQILGPSPVINKLTVNIINPNCQNLNNGTLLEPFDNVSFLVTCFLFSVSSFFFFFEKE